MIPYKCITVCVCDCKTCCFFFFKFTSVLLCERSYTVPGGGVPHPVLVAYPVLTRGYPSPVLARGYPKTGISPCLGLGLTDILPCPQGLPGLGYLHLGPGYTL